MLRSILRAAVVLSALVVAPSAIAADLGAAGTIYLGAERMFGVSWNQFKVDRGVDGTSSYSNTDVGLLWPASHTLSDNAVPSPYTIPRIGFDYAIIQNLTIGGAIGFASSSLSTKTERNGASVTQDGDTFTSFLISPRVGYMIGLSDKMGIWLRGGFTFFNLSDKSPEVNGRKTTNSANGFAFSLDPIFVLSPVEHFGFFGGIMLDLPLTGTLKNETVTPGRTDSTSYDSKATNFGLNFGLLGYF
ncbi:MAG: hypothetical protein ACXWUG_11960 [Polyangiales bacterium]